MSSETDKLSESVASEAGAEETAVDPGFVASIINEIIYSPVNLILVFLIAFLIYKIIKEKFSVPESKASTPEPQLPKLRKDFTVQELRQYDGKGPDGRILIAVNGNVFDVTKGKRFYGPGGPYEAFGGRDASRCLATFSVTAADKEEYDDLSDLNPMEMESVREWETQFKEKYDLVGRLLRPGEEPSSYSDEEEEPLTGEKPPETIESESTESSSLKKRSVIKENNNAGNNENNEESTKKSEN